MFNSVFYRVAGPARRIFVLSAQAKNSPVGFDFSPPGLLFSIIRNILAEWWHGLPARENTAKMAVPRTFPSNG